MSAKESLLSVTSPALWAKDVEPSVSLASARAGATEGSMSTVVGRNLRALRKQRRWTLDDLAQCSGVSRAMLGQVEQGKSLPSVKTLWQVAQALGVSLDWFLDAGHERRLLLIRPAQVEEIPLTAGEGELRPLLQHADATGDEFHELRLAPQAELCLPAAKAGRRVNMAVSAGVIDVLIDDGLYTVLRREALQWDGPEAIVCRNPGLVEARAFVVARAMNRWP